ncbi:MAG TPA: NUDIX domain-containing protein [Egibacteraceae bacterium]|nr:NUDIX domain-containing protein [Egibacteraceae bacterium]
MSGHVAALRRLVAAMAPVDERHERSIREVLAGLDTLDRPLDEHADATHVTSSAIVMGPRGTLLHRHKRLGLWLQPGGHIEPGEAPADAAVRETLEETGIVARHPEDGPALVHVDAHDGGRGHRHLDLRYLLLAGDEDPRPPQGESQDVQWFPIDDAIRVADLGLAGALRHVGEHAGR